MDAANAAALVALPVSFRFFMDEGVRGQLDDRGTAPLCESRQPLPPALCDSRALPPPRRSPMLLLRWCGCGCTAMAMAAEDDDAAAAAAAA